MFLRIWLGVNFLVLLASVITYSAEVHANIPAGFEDLFEEKSVKLRLTLSADKNKSFSIDAYVSGDEVRVQASQQMLLRQSLSKVFSVDDRMSENIASSLVTGVESSQDCVGYRSDCGLLPQFYDFVYVPDSQSLIVHVNSKFLREEQEEIEIEFVKAQTDHNAIIISHGLNVSGSYSETSDYTSAYSYQHENYVGFGQYGYLHNDLNFSDVNGFSSDDSSYNYVEGNTRFSVGYKYQERAWNSTQFLENNSKTSGYMLSVGSTKELVKTASVNSRRVYLNIQRAGRLEINDDRGRVLLSRNVNAGQDFLTTTNFLSAPIQ